jgi:hypothetical protein
MAEIVATRRARVAGDGAARRRVPSGDPVAAAVLALALAGCAGSTGTLPNVTGNEQGGKVPYAEGNMPAAMDAAKAHCASFNKKAQIIQMSPGTDGGGVVGFQCR